METSQQAAVRLVGAVEVLMAQEAVMVASGQRAGLVKIMHRAAPLFHRLATLGPAAADPNLRSRLAQVAEIRRRTRFFLDSQMTSLAAELERVRFAQQRLRRVAPAYSRTFGKIRRGSSRLSAFS